MLFEQLGLISLDTVKVTGSSGSGNNAGQENVDYFFEIYYTLTTYHENTKQELLDA
jgi:hypothetical protein